MFGNSRCVKKITCLDKENQQVRLDQLPGARQLWVWILVWPLTTSMSFVKLLNLIWSLQKGYYFADVLQPMFSKPFQTVLQTCLCTLSSLFRVISTCFWIAPHPHSACVHRVLPAVWRRCHGLLFSLALAELSASVCAAVAMPLWALKVSQLFQ